MKMSWMNEGNFFYKPHQVDIQVGDHKTGVKTNGKKAGVQIDRTGRQRDWQENRLNYWP